MSDTAWFYVRFLFTYLGWYGVEYFRMETRPDYHIGIDKVIGMPVLFGIMTFVYLMFSNRKMSTETQELEDVMDRCAVMLECCRKESCTEISKNMVEQIRDCKRLSPASRRDMLYAYAEEAKDALYCLDLYDDDDNSSARTVSVKVRELLVLTLGKMSRRHKES